MENSKLNLVIFYALIATAAISVTLGYLLSIKAREVQHYKTSSERSAKAVKTAATIIRTYIDTAGRSHVVVDANENRLAYGNIAVSPGLLDTTAAALRIARNKIENLTVISTIRKDSLLQAKAEINNLTKRLAFVYNDPYVSLKYNPAPDTSKPGTFDFTYNADLNIVQYSKRAWFLGQKKSLIDISSTDTRTTIRGVKRLTVEQKTPSFGARLRASTTYSPETGILLFGPEASFDIGRFQIRANYNYNSTLGQWRPTFTGSYDVIRF